MAHFQLLEGWVYKWNLSTAWFYFSPHFWSFYVCITGSEEFPEEFVMPPLRYIICQAKLDSINTGSSKCNFSVKHHPLIFPVSLVCQHKLTARITSTKQSGFPCPAPFVLKQELSKAVWKSSLIPD